MITKDSTEIKALAQSFWENASEEYQKLELWRASDEMDWDPEIHGVEDYQVTRVLNDTERALNYFQRAKKLKLYNTDKHGFFKNHTGFKGREAAKFVGFTDRGYVRAEVDGEVITFEPRSHFFPPRAINKKRKLGVEVPIN